MAKSVTHLHVSKPPKLTTSCPKMKQMTHLSPAQAADLSRREIWPCGGATRLLRAPAMLAAFGLLAVAVRPRRRSGRASALRCLSPTAEPVLHPPAMDPPLIRPRSAGQHAKPYLQLPGRTCR